MRKKTRLILSLTIISGIILLKEIMIDHFFPDLTFINGTLTITNRIVDDFAFSIFILSIPLLFNVRKILTIPLGVVLFSFFFVNSCAEIYPFDTTTEPVDVSILKTYDSGSKLIIREYKNVKTNEIIHDTVLVKDNFIFRQIIDETQKTTNR